MLGIKLWVLGLIGVGLLLLRWRRAGMLAWALGWWLALYVLFRYGFVVPVPGSVITLYMAIVTGALLAYVSSDRERWASFSGPISKLVLEPRLRPLLAAVVVLLPALSAYGVYARMNVPLEAPAFGRTIHPSPPDQIKVLESDIDLRRAENPFRALKQDDPDAFARHVENGRRVYYENCFFCHGDGLGGDGMFAHGLNPIPTNFTDTGILPILQSSFLLWRISKGGAGLPEEGGPWDSAMPVWEQFLTVDDMWDVILFLHEFTGFEPRSVSEEAHE